MERWEADEAFRELLEQSPREAALRYGLRADAEAARPIWDANADQTLPASQGVDRYRSFVREKLAHRDELRHNETSVDQPVWWDQIGG